MAKRKSFQKNFKSYLGIHELKRLGINPIEEALKCVAELDGVIKKSLDAYDNMRGYGEKNDAGTSYISTARTAIKDKADIYMGLSKFIYPTLAAVAVQDLTEDTGEHEQISTSEAIKIINSDPFRRGTDEKVVEAMNRVESMQLLPIGKKDE